MDNNITHQQEHAEVVEELQDLSHEMTAIYDEFHNGDKKKNRTIIAAQARVEKIREMVRSHARRTLGDDTRLDRSRKMEKWVYVLLPIVTTLAGKLIYDLVKMYG